MQPIAFNRPFHTGREQVYIAQALEQGKTSGDGPFTRRCHEWLERRYGFPQALLTSSCTDALEIAALLSDVGPGDEVIVPSFTFVSSASAFALRDAKLVFADSGADHPNVTAEEIARLITPRTRAVVVVHYAGMACEMDRIQALLRGTGIRLIEDAAQAIDGTFLGRPLGSFGDAATFSFHDTKNISAGEGGALVVNRAEWQARAEILREKGTNRSAFFRGEVDKYSWVDLGSSFLPSDITAAYLMAQLESLDDIQRRRRAVWYRYHERLADVLGRFGVEAPVVPRGASPNGHMYYVVCRDLDQRTRLMGRLKEAGIQSAFHYVSLHSSRYHAALHDGRPLWNSDRFSDTLLRLPLHAHLTLDDVDRICDAVLQALAADQTGRVHPAVHADASPQPLVAPPGPMPGRVPMHVVAGGGSTRPAPLMAVGGR